MRRTEDIEKRRQIKVWGAEKEIVSGERDRIRGGEKRQERG